MLYSPITTLDTRRQSIHRIQIEWPSTSAFGSTVRNRSSGNTLRAFGRDGEFEARLPDRLLLLSERLVGNPETGRARFCDTATFRQRGFSSAGSARAIPRHWAIYGDL